MTELGVARQDAPEEEHMATAPTVAQAVTAVAKASLATSIRDGLVDFLAKSAKDLGSKEVSDRIAALRSDAKMQREIQQSLQHATERWARDYPDRDLVAAVAAVTTFADLPSVRQAFLVGLRKVARIAFLAGRNVA
jgi:hypothetical protein